MLERLDNRHRSVVRVLVEMLAPYKGRVYDPCCGSASMFAKQVGIRDLAGFGEKSIKWLYCGIKNTLSQSKMFAKTID